MLRGNKAKTTALLALVGYIAYVFFRASGNPSADANLIVVSDIQESIMQAKKIIGGWDTSMIPRIYREAITEAETRYGLPTGLLGRLLWQESRYRVDIITGAVVSPVGALGIAQFMPATAEQYGLDPLDPYASIDAAGRYLADIKRYLGTGAGWAETLAAYNWGMGNVKRKGLASAPTETVNYYTSILNDTGIA